jgi:cupin 2 domain-containing protein
MEKLPRIFNMFAAVPGELPDELTQTIMNSGAVRVERIISRGHCSPEGRWYDQESAEFVALLKGSAGLRFEGYEQELVMRPGDCIDIPAHARHRVAWTDPHEDTVWLAFHYPGSGR